MAVAGLSLAAVAAGVLAVHWYLRPSILTVAVGTQDGEAQKLVSAIAVQLAKSNAPVRLHVKETPTALDAAIAFSAAAGTDLAVVRGDVGDLSKAQAVVVLAEAVVLLLAPASSQLEDVSRLKRGATVGVLSGDTNRRIVDILTREFNLDRIGVTFRNLPAADIRRSVQTGELALVLAVLPINEKYLTLVRGLFPAGKNSPQPVAIGSAGAIAEKEQAYEAFDLPKGTLRNAPPVPSDDLPTLKVPFYLVAHKEAGNEMISDLTEAVMKARRDLVADWPMLAHMTSPNMDADAFLPVHPGAATYFNGDRLNLLDRWGNIIFIVPMVLGGCVSLYAAARRFIREDLDTSDRPLSQLYALGERIRTTEDEAALDIIENEIERLLRSQPLDDAAAEATALNVTSLNVTAHRLENMIRDRRESLARGNGQRALPTSRTSASQTGSPTSAGAQ